MLDDDESILQVISIVLSEEDFDVTSTSTKEEFQAAIISQMPDLILLDIFIGDDDGREVSKELKNDTDTQDVPIILMSAHLHDHEQVLNTGADAYLEKPFDIEQLVQLVRTHVN